MLERNMKARIVDLITSYKFFLWFMRIATIPIMAGCFYMARSSWYELKVTPSSDAMLPLLVGLFGGTFALAYFLVAWTCGWKKEKENRQ
jgi:hypothetical protein